MSRNVWESQWSRLWRQSTTRAWLSMVVHTIKEVEDYNEWEGEPLFRRDPERDFYQERRMEMRRAEVSSLNNEERGGMMEWENLQTNSIRTVAEKNKREAHWRLKAASSGNILLQTFALVIITYNREFLNLYAPYTREIIMSVALLQRAKDPATNYSPYSPK